MDDREQEIRQAEIARGRLHKRADLALMVLRMESDGILDGDEWKHRRPVNKDLIEAAEALLTSFLAKDQG
jgi:hypothetical protein